MMKTDKTFTAHQARVDYFLPIFTEIQKRFKPVMRHYFTEQNKVPMTWFAMRLKYARSVATTSIVGHILGLGDRHCSNILLDNGTGEVVHIDLGIAFDQVSGAVGTVLTVMSLTYFSVGKTLAYTGARAVPYDGRYS